jgi:tol-pal system protein YbgF
MKILQHVALAGCGLLLLTSCASQDEIRKLNYQIRAVNQKVEEVKATAVNQMQKRQASSVNKLDAVEGETQQLRALVEESNQKSNQLREQTVQDLAALSAQIEQLRAENEQRIKALELKVEQLSDTLVRTQQARVQAAEQKAREAARRAEEAKKRTVMAAGPGSSGLVILRPSGRKVKMGTDTVVEAPARAVQAKPTSSASATTTVPAAEMPEKTVVPAAKPVRDSGGDIFSQAMTAFKAGKYKDAYRGFEQVLAGNPEGAKAAQTLFYMGECLFNQGEYDLAILDYQKVISNHGKDPHTPSAMLKQGMSFEKLTDHETAKIIYKKLIAGYPDSSEAGLARKRLESL